MKNKEESFLKKCFTIGAWVAWPILLFGLVFIVDSIKNADAHSGDAALDKVQRLERHIVELNRTIDNYKEQVGNLHIELREITRLKNNLDVAESNYRFCQGLLEEAHVAIDKLESQSCPAATGQPATAQSSMASPAPSCIESGGCASKSSGSGSAATGSSPVYISVNNVHGPSCGVQAGNNIVSVELRKQYLNQRVAIKIASVRATESGSGIANHGYYIEPDDVVLDSNNTYACLEVFTPNESESGKMMYMLFENGGESIGAFTAVHVPPPALAPLAIVIDKTTLDLSDPRTRSASFKVKLNRQPAGSVRLGGATTGGSLTPAWKSFDATNWNVEQTYQFTIDDNMKSARIDVTGFDVSTQPFTPLTSQSIAVTLPVGGSGLTPPTCKENQTLRRLEDGEWWCDSLDADGFSVSSLTEWGGMKFQTITTPNNITLPHIGNTTFVDFKDAGGDTDAPLTWMLAICDVGDPLVDGVRFEQTLPIDISEETGVYRLYNTNEAMGIRSAEKGGKKGLRLSTAGSSKPRSERTPEDYYDVLEASRYSCTFRSITPFKVKVTTGHLAEE